MHFEFKHVDEYVGKCKVSYFVISYDGGLSMFSIFNIITHDRVIVTNWFTLLTIRG
jgi:hypothetical protein